MRNMRLFKEVLTHKSCVYDRRLFEGALYRRIAVETASLEKKDDEARRSNQEYLILELKTYDSQSTSNERKKITRLTQFV